MIIYADRGNIRFIHGDCNQWMESKEKNHYDLAIVDPPYGGEDAIAVKSTKAKSNSGIRHDHYAKRTVYEQFENTPPNSEYFKLLETVSKERIVWGWNFLEQCYYTGGVLVWNKKGTAFGEAEIAHCSMFKSVRIYELIWNGFLKYKGHEILKRFHPTAKPKRLYEYCLINFAPQDKPIRILDTHGGSCSIARAVYDVNKLDKFDISIDIIEMNESYLKQAVKDFDTHTKQLTMF